MLEAGNSLNHGPINETINISQHHPTKLKKKSGRDYFDTNVKPSTIIKSSFF